MLSWFMRKCVEQQKLEAAYLKAMKECAEEDHSFKTKKMLDSHCPINGAKCSATCVHFDEGGVYSSTTMFPTRETKDMWRVNYPSCKLWAKEAE